MTMPILALLLLTGTTLLAQDEASGERKLATIPEGLELSRTSTGPDGSQVDVQPRFAFGAGGKFVAYMAFRGGKSVAMVGEQELGEFHYLHQPTMDVNATHYAFRAGNRKSPKKERWWVIVDGKKSKTYAWIGEVAIGSSGNAAFWEQPGAKIVAGGAYNNSSMLFHVGKRKGKKFESAMSLFAPSFSADGKTAVSAALRGRQWFAITATTKKEKVGKDGYASVEDAVLSPDGKRTALVIVEGGMPLPPGVPPPPGVTAGKMRVAVDGKTYGDDTDGAGVPTFAPDNKRFVFKYVQGKKMGLAFDDEKTPEPKHEFLGNPTFREKGDTIAYVSNNGGTIDHHARLRRWGDRTMKGGGWSLHKRKRKGKEETLLEDVEGLAHVTFGPNGEIAYAQKAKGKMYIVVGDRRSEAFDQVDRPWWSEDGKRVEFGARKDRELWWKVLELE